MNWFTRKKTVDRIVLGAPAGVTIYEACTKKNVYVVMDGWRVEHKHHGYFLSCADAFAAFPGSTVEERKGLLVDGEYFIVPRGVEAVKVTKPKRGRGKADRLTGKLG